ncbi:MAG: CapA family protein [Brevinematia bacterium]
MKRFIYFLLFVLLNSNHIETPVEKNERIIINAVGDTMTGSYFPEKRLPPDDGESSFRFINLYLTNNNPDILLANLEGVITLLKKPVKAIIPRRSYAFSLPTNTARILREAGFNVITYANNHARDFGDAGLLDTERYLLKEGILFTGRKGEFLSLEKNGIKVGIIAFSWHSWANNYKDLESSLKLIRKVKISNDVVILSVHGGSEGEKAMYIPDGEEYLFNENRGNLYRFCRLAVDNGADLVIGHGPHVIRGIESYNGKLIAYSLGNFLTPVMSTKGNKKYAFILSVTLDKKGNFLEGYVVPTRQYSGNNFNGIPYYDEEKTSIKILQKLSRENFKNNPLRIDDNGKISIELMERERL